MGLVSKAFQGDPKLEACLIQDSAHVTPGTVGEHVGKIQTALILVDSSSIDAGEKAAKRYGPSTAAAVLAFKRKRNVVNYSYQTQADNIVGKMTIAALDKEVLAKETSEPRGRVLALGMTGRDVVTLQLLLNYHLYGLYSELHADGNFGPQTHARVVEFQRRNQNYPVKMPVKGEKKPLACNGVVDEETLRVLLDFRTVSAPGTRMTPHEGAASKSGSGPFTRGMAVVGDVPAGDEPPKVVRFATVQAGAQAQLEPWIVSPLVLTLQATMLARNNGRPDFLLTAGGQAALNLDPKAGTTWTGQGFLQMGLGGLPVKFGNLDLFNPFVQLMIQKTQGQPLAIGGAIGNQVNYSLSRRPLGGQDQDVVSIFFNLQAVSLVGMDSGKCDVPRTQGMLGLSVSAF